MGGSFFRHLDSWQLRLEKLQTENVCLMKPNEIGGRAIMMVLFAN